PTSVERLRAAGCRCMIRVNATSDLIADDLRAVVATGVRYIVVPKVETVDCVRRIVTLLAALELDGDAAAHCSIIASIESPRGITNSVAIAADERVAGLVFGPEDYCAALGVASQFAALEWPLQQLAVAAAASGRACFGVPGTITDYKDSV